MMTRLARTLLACALVAGGLLAVLLVPATAASTGAVHGTVTTDGAAVKGLKVELLAMTSDDDDDVDVTNPVFVPVSSDNTNTDGTYTFTGLSLTFPHFYGLRISDPKGFHATTYDRIYPKSGKTITVDESVLAAGILAGKVTRADHASPVEIKAELHGGPSFDSDNTVAMDGDVPVAAVGSFEFKGVVPTGDAPADKYYVKLLDRSGKYVPQCYEDAVLTAVGTECDDPSVPAATVSIEAGHTTTLADQALSHLAGHVNGTVTDTFGHPLKGLDVSAVLPDQGAFPYQSAQSRSTSRYSIGGLQVGQYKISITDPKHVWAGEWYDNKSVTTAHIFDLADGQTVSGVAFELKSKSVIHVKATGGVGTATMVVSIERRASSSHPSGTVTVTFGSTSKTATLSGGAATVKLTGIPSGLRKFNISYSGAGSTAGTTRNGVSVTVK